MNQCGSTLGKVRVPQGPRWLLGAVVALLMAAVSVASVAAHADLIATEPAAGSTVVGSPATIRLSFSQPLLATSQIQLFTGRFSPVAGLTTVVAGSEIQAVVGQPLAPATYTVQWSAVTDDGHTTEGSFQFGVAGSKAIVFDSSKLTRFRKHAAYKSVPPKSTPLLIRQRAFGWRIPD